MAKIVIAGAGFAGCGAAVAAAQTGVEVTLVERMEDVLGNGLAAGNMKMNGRFTAAEEAKAMGGGLVLDALDTVTRHINVEIPIMKHMTVYDVFKAPIVVKDALRHLGIRLLLSKRVKGVTRSGGTLKAVITDDNKRIEGDAFVDCTGSVGGPSTCTKYGHGCTMCIYRCYTFGNPVSLAKKAGATEIAWRNLEGRIGVMSGAVDILKDSVSPEIVQKLEKDGTLVIPIPESSVDLKKIRIKATTQTSIDDYELNLVLVDSGHVKLASPYFDLDKLRGVKGFENARFADPLAGGVGNSIRHISIALRDSFLKVDGLNNLFCAGEKSGPLVGLTEAYVTGLLAGYNASRCAAEESLVQLPSNTVIGDFIALIGDEIHKSERERQKGSFTFSGGKYFERMKTLGLYTLDVNEIHKRIKDNQLEGIFQMSVEQNKTKIKRVNKEI
jgi:hypothetical protein